MIDIIAAILLFGLLGECPAPGGAGRQPPRQWSVRVWQGRLDYRWQLREWPGPLHVLPMLPGPYVFLEIELAEHMLDRRQDRSS